jgi:UDP-glucose 4-epimerase
LKNKRILITGASGFIGTHLTKYLLEKNYELELTFCRNKINKEFKKYTNQISLDLKRDEDLKNIPKNIKAVFHLANFAPVDDSHDSFRETFNINSFGTLKLLETCRNTGIQKFINSSSISVYGACRKGKISERHLPKPDSYYGISKLMGELYCERFNKLSKLSVISLRYSSVYGAGQKPNTVLPIFINNALKNKKIEIHGKGTKTQDFVYIKDVLDANYLALHSNKSGPFNIASGKGTNVMNLAILIKKYFSSGKSEILLNNKRQGDNTNYYFNISKARKNLGYKVRYPIKKGLCDYKKTCSPVLPIDRVL